MDENGTVMWALNHPNNMTHLTLCFLSIDLLSAGDGLRAANKSLPFRVCMCVCLFGVAFVRSRFHLSSVTLGSDASEMQ